MTLRSGRSWLCVWLLAGLLWPTAGIAQTELRWAIVDWLSAQVQLKPDGADSRAAQVNDLVKDNDVLETAAADSAELSFDNGSLLRLGANTVLRFSESSQSLQLSHGTLLLVTPAAAPLVQVQTPNAIAEVSGTALFVRYIPDTQTTVVGALTDGLQVVHANAASNAQPALQAGQMITVTSTTIGPRYDFDLLAFYETSRLAHSLVPIGNEDLDAVSLAEDTRLQVTYQNMQNALLAQTPLTGAQVVDNPNFIGSVVPNGTADRSSASDATSETAGASASPTAIPEASSAVEPSNPSTRDRTAPPPADVQPPGPSGTGSSSEATPTGTEATTPTTETETLDNSLSPSPNGLDAVDFDSSISAEINPENEPTTAAPSETTAPLPADTP